MMVVDIKVLRGKLSKVSDLTDEERKFVDSAILSKYLEYSVKVSAILTLVKLTFDEDKISSFRELLIKARKSAEEGKNPWSPADVKKLTDMFSFLKPDSRGKIIHTITMGDQLFLYMLEDSLMGLDVNEADKLTGLV